jgi:hypothetical protein
MATILNYTGKRIGLTNNTGRPIQVLAVNGNARCEVDDKEKLTVGRTPIYTRSSKVRGLPQPDPNLEKIYIVSRDVAEAVGNTRFDLVVPVEPFQFEGATFYKKLIEV